MPQLTRRQALASGLAWSTFAVLPRFGRAASPNGKLRTAHIGVGGMGGSDLKSVSSHPLVEVAALCDVDSERLAAAKAGGGKKGGPAFPNAKTYVDYRDLIDELGDSIDAVVVSTPDHTHAPAAMTALHAGKPVYCQKPLTHEVHEARQLRLKAEAMDVPTQMGIQIHSRQEYREAVAMIQSGAIGKVSQVYAWSSKDWGFDENALPAATEAPANLDWDRWLGVTSKRAYVPGVYHPGKWRKLIDFGTGTLGDMGVHIFDTPFGALELTSPNWVKTSCRQPTGVGHPSRNIVEYEFPGTKYTTETMLWTWSDGSFAPPEISDDRLPADLSLPSQGSLFIGEAGVMLLPHIGRARLFPEAEFTDYKRPEVENGNHYHQWVNACLGEGQCSADFTFGGKLTEALLLGVVANRYPDQKLEWKEATMTIPNLPAAEALLQRNYRAGFEVAGLG